MLSIKKKQYAPLALINLFSNEQVNRRYDKNTKDCYTCITLFSN